MSNCSLLGSSEKSWALIVRTFGVQVGFFGTFLAPAREVGPPQLEASQGQAIHGQGLGGGTSEAQTSWDCMASVLLATYCRICLPSYIHIGI